MSTRVGWLWFTLASSVLELFLHASSKHVMEPSSAEKKVFACSNTLLLDSHVLPTIGEYFLNPQSFNKKIKVPINSLL